MGVGMRHDLPRNLKRFYCVLQHDRSVGPHLIACAPEGMLQDSNFGDG